MTAIVIAGGEGFSAEYAAALALCADLPEAPVCFLVNDQIASMPLAGAHGVTLHPAKLGAWLTTREAAGLPPLAAVWCWKGATPGVTCVIADWGGSSGLLAVRAALKSGHTRVILCGVPMTASGGHFLRRRSWQHAVGFQKGWLQHRGDLAPFVRSMSGWTQATFGTPTREWLRA